MGRLLSQGQYDFVLNPVFRAAVSRIPPPVSVVLGCCENSFHPLPSASGTPLSFSRFLSGVGFDSIQPLPVSFLPTFFACLFLVRASTAMEIESSSDPRTRRI